MMLDLPLVVLLGSCFYHGHRIVQSRAPPDHAFTYRSPEHFPSRPRQHCARPTLRGVKAHRISLPKLCETGDISPQWQQMGIIPKLLILILILILQVHKGSMRQVCCCSAKEVPPSLAPLLLTIGGGGGGFMYFYNMHQTGPPRRLLARLRTVPYDRGGLLVFGGRWQPGSSFHSHPPP
jgi:hypothetical protein